MKYLIGALIIAVLLIPALSTSAEAAYCFNVYPFCDNVTLDVSPNGQIMGWSDDCGSGCDFPVVGQVVGNNWGVVLDFQDDKCGHAFEYGIMMGSGFNGVLHRYYADGTYAGSTDVTLVPCTLNAQGNKGRASAE